MKLLNSVASVLMCGEFLAWLVHIHAIFHRYCTVHCKIMIPREDASITRMCILATLPLSCTVDPYFIFKFLQFKKILVCLVFVVTCDCSVRISYMTVVLEHISSQPRGVQLAKPIRGEVILFTIT